MAAMPTGTLHQNTQCQDRPCTMAPPATGPKATAEPVIAPQAPMALPRWPGGNAEQARARLSGEISAAEAPCTARAAMSSPGVAAVAHAADAAVNTARPATNIRRRPSRSPSAAPARISTPKAST